jgi:hypothetical protein
MAFVMRSLVPFVASCVIALAGVACAAPSSEEEAATDEAAIVVDDDPDDFYVIAHMTNTPEAIRWAAAEGANAVEIDVRFDEGDGTPNTVRHGGICDCICSLGHDDHVCAALSRDCEASSSIPDVLSAIAAQPELALVIVDSKIDGDAPPDVQRSAGARMVDAIDVGLFSRGYHGKVVIGAPQTDALPYVQSAAAAASASTWASRISVGFDQTGKRESDATCTLHTLSSFTKRRAFGAGISACAVGDFTPAIRTGAALERTGDSGLTYVWTLDREESMRRYIDAGARGIITNKPRRLAAVARSLGKKMARAETTLGTAPDRSIEGADACR